MKETLGEKIAWRRRGVRSAYVGTLSAGDEGIRLTGRDPVSGVDVTLSIPLAEVDGVRLAAPGEELLAGERCVVLELAQSEAIFLRQVGVGPLQAHVLARSLGALAHVQPALARGG